MDAVLERLILALAAQLDQACPVLTPGAVEALAGLSRAEAGLIFSLAGHLVHYEADSEAVRGLVQLISGIQRSEAAEGAAIRPGDEVRIAGEVPTSLADYDPTWVRETSFLVRYVGDDATVDVQPDLTEDYLVKRVPLASVKPVQTRREP